MPVATLCVPDRYPFAATQAITPCKNATSRIGKPVDFLMRLVAFCAWCYFLFSRSMPMSETPGSISRFMLCLTVMCSESFALSLMTDTGIWYW